MASPNSAAVVPSASFPFIVCAGEGRAARAGVRRPGRREDWWDESLLRGGNEALWRDPADGALWLCTAGGRVEVGASSEGVKLDFALTCGEHLRRCTPNAVRTRKHLLCRFCTPPMTLKNARCERPSGLERTMHTLLCRLRPGAEWRWQVCPQVGLLRPKPMDFFHAPTGLYLEVDGQQHFTGGMHGTPSSKQQRIDLKYMRALWAAGAALVRVHCADLAGAAPRAAAAAQAALGWAAAGGSGPLVVLSPSFHPCLLSATCPMQDPWHFLDTLQEGLGAAARTRDGTGCIWFWPSPQLTM